MVQQSKYLGVYDQPKTEVFAAYNQLTLQPLDAVLYEEYKRAENTKKLQGIPSLPVVHVERDMELWAQNLKVDKNPSVDFSFVLDNGRCRLVECKLRCENFRNEENYEVEDKVKFSRELLGLENNFVEGCILIFPEALYAEKREEIRGWASRYLRGRPNFCEVMSIKTMIDKYSMHG